MADSSPTANQAVVIRVIQSLYGAAPGYNVLQTHVHYIADDGLAAYLTTLASQPRFASMTDEQFAQLLMDNMGLTAVYQANPATALSPAQLASYIAATATGFPDHAAARGQAALSLANLLAGLENAAGAQAIYSNAAHALNSQANNAYAYSSSPGNPLPSPAPAAHMPLLGDEATVIHLLRALFGAPPSGRMLEDQSAYVEANGVQAYAAKYASYFSSFTDAQFADLMMTNLGLKAANAAHPGASLSVSDLAHYIATVESGAANIAAVRGAVALQLFDILLGLENASGSLSVYSDAAVALNQTVNEDYAWAMENYDMPPVTIAGTVSPDFASFASV